MRHWSFSLPYSLNTWVIVLVGPLQPLYLFQYWLSSLSSVLHVGCSSCRGRSQCPYHQKLGILPLCHRADLSVCGRRTRNSQRHRRTYTPVVEGRQGVLLRSMSAFGPCLGCFDGRVEYVAVVPRLRCRMPFVWLRYRDAYGNR